MIRNSGTKTPFAIARAVRCVLGTGLLTAASALACAGSDGAVVGIVTNSAKLPIAHATVTANRVDGDGFRATMSGSDGVYTFADLPPGTWVIRAKIDGLAALTAPPVTVVAEDATRFDIVLNGASGAPSGAPAPAPLGVPSTAPVNAAAAAAIRTPSVLVAAAAVPTVPEALQAPDPAPEVDNDTPFAFGDFTWVNGGSRQKAPTFDTKFFTPEIRFDANYLEDFNQPKDHTIVGSTEEFRSNEFQIEQVSFGGDFHWHNVKARFLSMMGLFATTTPPNDASSGVGQWDLHSAYKFLSEANAGYHFDVQHGLNIDAGIFVSYIGLFAYYNFDNWTYQPSFVSSNTPWFFNGLRIQWYPTNKLKIEPWLINGWQSYAKYNSRLGFGGQILYTPNDSVKLVFNSYGIGQDNLASGSVGAGVNPGLPVGRGSIGQANPNAPAINYAIVQRIHEDDSLLVKYYENHENGAGLSKAAFTFTADIGCEYGGGVTCTHGPNKANFIGAMLYDRAWFHHDLWAVTAGGGFMNNPGRYLALTPPINGSSAQTNSPYFTQAPGLKLYQWDAQLNFQYMPNDWITWWTEGTFRHSDVPYFSGQGGVTPPLGNTGAPGSYVCNNGSAAGSDNCTAEGGLWYPDLRTREFIWGAGVMVRF
jgi:hypothetical protein